MKADSVTWLIGGTGVVLLYSAYKGRNPLAVIQKTISGEGGSTSLQGVSWLSPSAPAVDNSGGNDLEPKVLVPINGRGMKLAPNAAGGFQYAETLYGQEIPLTGAFRTYQQEYDGWLREPGRFVRPTKTQGYHVQGLAIDVDSSVQDDPSLIAALTQAGWVQFSHAKDPPHWSYGVRG